MREKHFEDGGAAISWAISAHSFGDLVEVFLGEGGAYLCLIDGIPMLES